MSQVKQYQRFELAQRIEHWVMVLSFTVLAVTGLPQKFAGDGWAEGMIAALGGIEFVRWIHHAAAIILILGALYHGISLMYKVIVKRTRWTMYPQLQDAMDALNTVQYNLGFRKQVPKYEHFSFGEKFEYWALVWGTLIMAVTGFMLWNPIITSRWVSGEVIPAAKAAHGAEAILAVLAVLVWHMYNVHLKHLNMAMFTGKLSQHEMEQEHGLELERIERGDTLRAPDPAKISQRQRIFFPIAIVISLALLFGVFLFATAETTAVTTIQRAAATIQVYAPATKTATPTRLPTGQAVQATPSTGSGTAKALPADHEGRVVCTACHAAGVGGAPKSPADHEGRLDAQCQACHKPLATSAGTQSTTVPTTAATATAAATSAAAQPTTANTPQAEATATSAAAQPTTANTPQAEATPPSSGGGGTAKALPADHAGRTTCTACHATGVGGAPKSPADHEGRVDDQCQACHKPQ